jgi:hypothetical protein
VIGWIVVVGKRSKFLLSIRLLKDALASFNPRQASDFASLRAKRLWRLVTLVSLAADAANLLAI